MVRWITNHRCGPIGIDLGSRSIKLLQMDAERQTLREAVRWELPLNAAEPEPKKPNGDSELLSESRADQLVDALIRAREGRRFRGRDAVLCLGAPQLFLQNIRVAKDAGEAFDRNLLQEAAGRIPFPVNQTELRFVEAADVRQGDSVRREVIAMAAHQPVLQQRLDICARAGLRPVAVDVEPAALLRCYVAQYRRDEDQRQRVMFVHIGAEQTCVVIAQGVNVLFIKYLDIGGRLMDEAVAKTLDTPLPDASALRRHNGDRRADQQDPEVARCVHESVRPVIDQLASELSMCVRYHSVTFRGQPLVRCVLGGGEASQTLADALATRLDLTCHLGDPIRGYGDAPSSSRKGQWDIAAGLALKATN
jgi:type IV pilus assembly protein PilM